MVPVVGCLSYQVEIHPPKYYNNILLYCEQERNAAGDPSLGHHE